MSLGFNLGLTSASQRRSPDTSPWWHSYAAPSGALPALVLEGKGGRRHGGSALNG